MTTATKAVRKVATMASTKTASTKTAGTKTAGTKTRVGASTRSPKGASGNAVTKDPEGGLTAAGRAAFKRSQGSQLKPGVMKSESEMTPEDMRRKGSWAARFYGRETLPALRKPNGEPTRFALSAHAWGEDVPQTEAQARAIAAKGRKLMERYREAKAAK